MMTVIKERVALMCVVRYNVNVRYRVAKKTAESDHCIVRRTLGALNSVGIPKQSSATQEKMNLLALSCNEYKYGAEGSQ